MFEDLQPQPTREKLKNTIKEFKNLLKESKIFILDQQQNFDDLKSDYDEVKTDARKFAGHIKNLHDKIREENLEDLFEDLGIDEMENS